MYFWSQRPSPSGFVFNYPLTDKTKCCAEYYSNVVLDELRELQPDLIVANRSQIESVDHPIEEWITREYKVVPGPEGVKRSVFFVPRQFPRLHPTQPISRSR